MASMSTWPASVVAFNRLLVTSTEANESVNFTVPTGEPGTPVTYNATVPVGGTSVPDNNFTGVTSTLTIPSAGYIKDVDVTFNIGR